MTRKMYICLMKKISLFLSLLLLPLGLSAEKPSVSVDGSLLFSSTYIWRGDRLCGFHLNPNVGVNLGGFRLENNSYFSTDGLYKEIDWDLSYTFGDFSIHLLDYFSHTAGDPEYYFDWRRGPSSHMDEIGLCYESSAIPLNVSWYTFVWGDWWENEDGTTGPLTFSSFLDIGTYYEFEDGGAASLTLGTSVLKGYYTDYSKSFMPVHIGLGYSKTLSAGKLSIPLEVQIVVNPYQRRVHAGASIGLAF